MYGQKVSHEPSPPAHARLQTYLFCLRRQNAIAPVSLYWVASLTAD